MTKALSTSGLMFVAGALLILWGLFVLLTGDFVATLDIAAGLIGWGVGAIGIGVIVRALQQIADRLEGRAFSTPDVRIETDEAATEPAFEPVLPAARTPAGGRVGARKLPPIPAEVPEGFAPPEPPKAAPVPPPAPHPEPELVREGTIEGRRYRFYSDGSIEAEGPGGIRRYKSIDEAREEILRQRGELEARQAPRPAAESEPPVQPAPPASERPRPTVRAPAAEPARPQTPVGQQPAAAPPPPRNPSPRPAPAKPAAEPTTWETYLAAGSTPTPAPGSGEPSSTPEPKPPASLDDEEWAEPFRMLLRGGTGTPPDGTDPKKR